MTTYDPSTYELARLFLQDEVGLGDEKHLVALACLIQTTIEEWIEEHKPEAVDEEEEEDPAWDD